jgi:hypothetical protein
MSDPPPPPKVSADGKFYWDGTRWVPMQGRSSQAPPMAQQHRPQGPPGYEIKKKGHGLRNGCIGCLGLIALIIIIAIAASGSHSPSTSFPSSPGTSGSPLPSPTPISEAAYKASAKSIPYVQLEKDPASMAGTVVTYTGQVVQYDSATTTSNLRINVTANSFGYTDTIWLDVDPAQTTNVFRNTVIQFWGEVVGPYTYTSVSGGQITIPEVNAKYVQVVG